MKKKVLLGFVIFLSLLLSIITVFSSFLFTIFNEDFYEKEFEKYRVYEKLSEYEVDRINKEVLLYLQDKKETLDKEFFNSKELSHMEDVKRIIISIYYLNIFSIILFIIVLILFIIKIKQNLIKKIGQILFYSGIIILSFSLLFYLLSLINFDFLFDFMHRSLFKEGTYTFNPLFDNIVVLYPVGLFNDIAIRIGISILLVSFFYLIIGLILLKKNKKLFKAR